MAPPARIELFFKTATELKSRVRELCRQGVHAYNLVNKHKDDSMLDWIQAVAAEDPQADVCAHFSLKNNAVAARQGGADAMFQRFAGFMNAIATQPAGARLEVLLISGCNSRAPLETVECLRRWASHQATLAPARRCPVALGVAFNPYFPSEVDRQKERDRLLKKLETGAVSSVWLQFGTDLELLESACSWLASLGARRPKRIVGSMFLPTPRLIAQQRFRPWNGVFLSEAYLSGPAAATDITLAMADVYSRYEIEVIVEAPGVHSEADLELARRLVGAGRGATARPASADRAVSTVVDLERVPVLATDGDAGSHGRGEDGNGGGAVSKRPAAKRWRRAGQAAV